MGAEVRGRVEPDDVVQDTIARALESLERFRWEGEDSFLRWLATIAEFDGRRPPPGCEGMERRTG
jgi:DNA-directed RNA polymerase specialized sigma24 family protein